MNRSLDLSFHAWRGVGSDEQPDLFVWRWRLGLLTVTLCRVCVLKAYQDAKAEAARLRRAADGALGDLLGRKADDKGGEGKR